MAPSRGISTSLFSVRTLISIRTPSPPIRNSQWRAYSSSTSNFTKSLSSHRPQIYISRSTSPYLNLSLEHHLLQCTPEDSTILFLYTNAPSIIIGRNQNPWTEVNLGLLASQRRGGKQPQNRKGGEGTSESKGWDLVRRRSGGGTVFHDLGNVNYSVICPSAVFDRDKHASMVVRALQNLGVSNARVNCRHDIVVDQPNGKTFKISGSAYKLTRLRSLHHGTCLLNSQNLGLVSKLLRAPGKEYITARGVESVRSPITNVDIQNADFEKAVVEEFKNMYDCRDREVVEVGDQEGEIEGVRKGMDELMSEDWIYDQTPQFTFSSKREPAEKSAGEDAEIGGLFPENFSADLTIRHGLIQSSSISTPHQQGEAISSLLLDKPLRSIHNWEDIFPSSSSQQQESKPIGKALNSIFGAGLLA